MPVRGIRGATTAPTNSREAIRDATRELLNAIVEANHIDIDDIASAYFTMTPDLDAAFPARAARDLGWNNAALLDAQAPRVTGDLPRCIRVLIHWNTNRTAGEIQHVYLRDARQLRPDRVSRPNPSPFPDREGETDSPLSSQERGKGRGQLKARSART